MVRRRQLNPREALIAAESLTSADVELFSTRSLLNHATAIAIELDHPAYECIYLALARANDWKFVTADDRFVRKVRHAHAGFKDIIISLPEAPARLSLGK